MGISLQRVVLPQPLPVPAPAPLPSTAPSLPPYPMASPGLPRPGSSLSLVQSWGQLATPATTNFSTLPCFSFWLCISLGVGGLDSKAAADVSREAQLVRLGRTPRQHQTHWAFTFVDAEAQRGQGMWLWAHCLMSGFPNSGHEVCQFGMTLNSLCRVKVRHDHHPEHNKRPAKGDRAGHRWLTPVTLAT